MFRAGLLLGEYKNFEPDSLDAIMASVARAGRDFDFITLDVESFARAGANRSTMR
jgi:mannose-1-phosphate guanylyltransferase